VKNAWCELPYGAEDREPVRRRSLTEADLGSVRRPSPIKLATAIICVLIAEWQSAEDL